MKRFLPLLLLAGCAQPVDGPAPATSPTQTPPAASSAPAPSSAPPASSLAVPREETGLTAPEGFTINTYATGFEKPRVLIRDPKGVLLVSDTDQGTVAALPDAGGDGKADRTIEVVGGLEKPHGIAFHARRLYIAETGVVSSYAYDPATMQASGRTKILDLPPGGGHFTRSIIFLSDGRFLVSVGSSCNVCVEEDPRRTTVIVANADGSDAKPYARGLRNAVYLAAHPVDGRIWTTEMGRDRLGDNLPPDEINILEEGKHYGFPNCYGKNIHDDDFDRNVYIRNPCMEPLETESHIDLPAHVAPLGLGFIPEEGWPEEMWHDLVVAEHGSWNSSVPVGYRIVRIELDESGIPGKTADLVTGFGRGKGRPAGVLLEPGGTMYFTDDERGRVYVMRRNG